MKMSGHGLIVLLIAGAVVGWVVEVFWIASISVDNHQFLNDPRLGELHAARGDLVSNSGRRPVMRATIARSLGLVLKVAFRRISRLMTSRFRRK
jgi:hypothetical protein